MTDRSIVVTSLQVPEQTVECVGDTFYYISGTLPDVQLQHLRQMFALHPRELLKQTLRDLHSVVNEHTFSSLRRIDWLVTNYAKSHTVRCRTGDPNLPYVNLYAMYLRWRHNYNRILLAPFRRGALIYYTADTKCNCMGRCGGRETGRTAAEVPLQAGAREDNKTRYVLATTVAQMNFFVFLRLHGVIDYVRDHSDAIEQDQSDCIRRAKELRAEKGDDFRRGKLSIELPPSCSVVAI